MEIFLLVFVYCEKSLSLENRSLKDQLTMSTKAPNSDLSNPLTVRQDSFGLSFLEPSRGKASEGCLLFIIFFGRSVVTGSDESLL